MEKKSENIILFFLVIFSIYCALNIGMTWDEPYHYDNGKNRLRYLLSLGKYDYHEFLHIRYYPGFYDTLTAFISHMMPKKYEVQIHHIINLLFSISTIVGVSKISKLLFNRKVSKIVFLILFFNPIFFGHMSMNPKDTIIAFSNVWSIYFIITYLQSQYIELKRSHLSTLIGITIGFGVGIRVIFLGTLLPIFILILLDIFFVRIFICEKFSLKKFLKDLIKVFLIAYFIMIIFWPNVYSNILILPFKLILTSLADNTQGSPWVLLNGEFFKTTNTPRSYLFINFFYKLPEFILFLYILFILIFFKDQKFFEEHFKSFKKKIFYVIFIILFPFTLAVIAGLKIHDGLRYFLFLIPYLCIIPGLTIFYLIYNSKSYLNKFFIILSFVSFLYYLFNFFSLTPYHYTYLNKFNGNFSNASKKFENDYWGASIKELISKIEKNKTFKEDKNYKIAFCGVNYDIASYYLSEIDDFSFTKTHKDETYDYIIMTNRHNGKDDDEKDEVKTCFDTYKGKDILSVVRNGLILSTIRKN